MPAAAARPPLRTGRRLARRLIALALGLAATGLALELAARAHLEGGFGNGVRSLFGAVPRAEAAESGAQLVPDAELGYALNRARPEINAQGMRAPKVAARQPGGPARALLLGDSVSFEPGGFAEELARALAPGCELLNACVPGYTARQERLWYERELAALAPDLVLWQYCCNDNHAQLHTLDRSGHRLLSPEARRSFAAAGDGALGRWLAHSYAWVELRRRLALRDARGPDSAWWDAREDFRTAWQPDSWPAYRAELEALAAGVRARGAQLVLLIAPLEAQLDALSAGMPRERACFPQQQIAAMARELELECIDLLPAFEREPDAHALFSDGIHFSPRGHALASAEILPHLMRMRAASAPPPGRAPAPSGG